MIIKSIGCDGVTENTDEVTKIEFCVDMKNNHFVSCTRVDGSTFECDIGRVDLVTDK